MNLQTVYDWPRRHPPVVDAALTGAMLLLLVVPTWLGLATWVGLTTGNGDRSALAAVVISTVMVLALAVRRRHPVLVFTTVSLCCLVQLFVWPNPLPADLAFLVAAYSLAAYADGLVLRLAGLAVAVLAGPLAAASWATVFGSAAVLLASFTGGLAVTAWIAGDLMRNRRAVLAALEAQNEALRRDQEQRGRLAAQQERARIARDMHDVVAHGLSVIVVQADGAAWAARHAPTWERDQSVETFEVLATTARAALGETRHLVGLLGTDDTTSTASTAGVEDRSPEDYSPVAGLRDLSGLVARVRDAGLDVRLEAAPVDEGEVPTETSLAAYRIAQECLTNVLKHGGSGARATVALTRAPDGLHLVVTDDGRGAAAEPAPLGGSGMIGMRQRADAVGGLLEAGPRAEGGFRVAAFLPVHGTPA